MSAQPSPAPNPDDAPPCSRSVTPTKAPIAAKMVRALMGQPCSDATMGTARTYMGTESKSCQGEVLLVGAKYADNSSDSHKI